MIANFSLFCNHITIIPTIKAIPDSPDLAHGFLGPGHVSMVIGSAAYDFIACDYGRPIVISGFEPFDVLQSLWMVIRQIAEGRAEVENQYARVVPRDGNAAALAAVREVFELREFFEWRGLGSIDHSGVRVREKYAQFDAERKFAAERRHRRPGGVPVRRSAHRTDQAAAMSSSGRRAHRRRRSAR